MIGTSAVLQEEYSEHYTIPQTRFFQEEKEDQVPECINLELSITDSETGKPISQAMVSMDALGRTGVCEADGKIVLQEIPLGSFVLDVIVPGYIASSTMLHFSAQKANSAVIKMVRNC